MTTFSYIITDEQGIHARPAGLLAKEAQKFTSSITLVKGEKTADVKKLFALMKLSAKKGEELVITVDGEDEKEAASAIEDFLKSNL